MKKSLIKYAEEVKTVLTFLMNGTPLCIYDLETTGLKAATDSVISFSVVKVECVDGVLRETGRMNQFINPGYHIPESATEVNGITDEMVASEPYEEEVYELIRAFWGEHPMIGGYNEKFDYEFLKHLYMRSAGEDFEPVFRIDVMMMVREMLEIKDFKLITAAQELGCDIGLSFHQSMDDVIATERIFELLLAMYMNQNNEEKKKRVKVSKVNYWAPRYDLARVYIYTYPMSGTYYDIYRKEWHSDLENIDMETLIQDVFLMMNVSDEKEMVKKVS